MTALGGRMRLLDSSGGEARHFSFLFIDLVILNGVDGLARESIHGVERPLGPRRLLLSPAGIPTTYPPGQSSCRELPSISLGYRQTRGPSTAQDRPRADD